MEDKDKEKTEDTGQDTTERQEPQEPQETAEQGTEECSRADAEAKETELEAEPADGGKDSAPEEKPAEDAAKEEESSRDGGFFSHKKKDDRQVRELKEKNEDLEDRLKRQLAEFDNYRRRTEKEKEQMFSMGERSVAEKILPIADNFERGLATVTEDGKDSEFVDGMRKVYRQFTETMDKIGIKPIEAVGKDFDPEYHSAVMQVDAEEGQESGKVVQELQKGYMYHDTVLRHTMVAVSK
ncbi:MAG: nucleotide exchange factor GrpE [Lachnospiraceae bacterium]|nr:nucleotide exchange factor GrpE [Lachnospiraceae bacterium]